MTDEHVGLMHSKTPCSQAVHGRGNDISHQRNNATVILRHCNHQRSSSIFVRPFEEVRPLFWGVGADFPETVADSLKQNGRVKAEDKRTPGGGSEALTKHESRQRTGTATGIPRTRGSTLPRGFSHDPGHNLEERHKQKAEMQECQVLGKKTG